MSSTTPLHGRPTRLLELQSIPPLLRPLIRAYFLGYASSVLPRLLTLLLRYITSIRKRHNATNEQKSQSGLLVSAHNILLTGLDWDRFPTFCAILAGGSTLLEIPFRRVFSSYAKSLSGTARTRFSRGLATFVAAWAGLRLLQSRRSYAFTELVPVRSETRPGTEHREVTHAGRTLDLSLFACCRAVDVLVGSAWAVWRTRRISEHKWTRLETVIQQSTDPWVFVSSCALIMWAWFYHPTRLPQAYRKWISSAAAVDHRLIETLQRCRTGEMHYGEDGDQAALLQGMCKDYNWPLSWGDPAQAIPFPCEMVHMGCGPSCEYHALSRFLRSFKWSMAMYLPLNLILRIRKRPTARSITVAAQSAARSSAFLASFIALFYYGVCLGRTRIGPRIIGKDVQSRQRIDSGLCVQCGCFLCGWSVLLETASRRKDMALFVAPRALATLFPRRYSQDKQWRETLVFAASAAVVFTSVREKDPRVRGVLGRLLAFVLR